MVKDCSFYFMLFICIDGVVENNVFMIIWSMFWCYFCIVIYGEGGVGKISFVLEIVWWSVKCFLDERLFFYVVVFVFFEGEIIDVGCFVWFVLGGD